jgi:outer membrane receptor protein involved in Fe transport
VALLNQEKIVGFLSDIGPWWNQQGWKLNQPGTICLISLILTAFLSQAVLAQGSDQKVSPGSIEDSREQIRSLEQELSEARNRVSDLEAELSRAQDNIRHLEQQDPVTVADTTTGEDVGPSSQAEGRTVDEVTSYGEQLPGNQAVQENVITEKYPPATQSLPFAMTRLLSDDLKRSGIRHLDRVSDRVPNMQYGQSGNEARISIRGMRTNRTGAEAEQVVAIFEDGVTVPTTTQAMGPYVDINRIEVLRGPQGVMYGRNAFGGVINVISNEPDFDGWDVFLEGTIGHADGTRFEAMLNVPVLDTLATRIAARSDVHSGYVGNHVLEGDGDDLHDRKQQFVRWMTTWRPSDKFSMALNIASLDQNQTGSGIWGYQQIGAYVEGQYLEGHQFAPEGAIPDKGPWSVRRNLASLEDQENLSGTLKLNWNMGIADLEWFINKSTFENQQVYDADYSDGGDPYNSDFNGWKSDRDTWSSELRLVSNSENRIDWVAGLYWFDMESRWHWLETVDGVYSKPVWDINGRYQTDSTSLFANAGYEIARNLRLHGGLRWYEDNKKIRTGSKDSWDGVLWSAGIEYDFDETMSSYFGVSTGYRPGGINETPGVPASFDSEEVTSWEIGLKSVLADDTLAINLSAFYNDHSDIQAQSFTILPLPGTAGLMDYMGTGGDVESKGFEAEIQWLPGSRWNISAHIAWLDAEFKDYAVPAIEGLGEIDGRDHGDTLSLDGWRPALSPEWSFGLQASYVFDLGESGTLTPMLQTSYVGEHYANDLNVSGARQGSYSKTDLRVFWDLPGDKVQMQVYIENMEDQQNLKNTMIYNPEERAEAATILADWHDPMTYGVILSYRY